MNPWLDRNKLFTVILFRRIRSLFSRGPRRRAKQVAAEERHAGKVTRTVLDRKSGEDYYRVVGR